MLPSSQPCCSVIRGPQPASSLCTSSPPTAPIQAKAPLSTEAALPHCCSLTALFPPVPKFSQLLSGCSKPGLASSSAVGVTGKTRNNGNLFLSKPIRLAGMTVILGSQVLPPNMAWQHQARVPRLLWAHTSRIFSLHPLLTTGIISSGPDGTKPRAGRPWCVLPVSPLICSPVSSRSFHCHGPVHRWTLLHFLLSYSRSWGFADGKHGTKIELYC